MATFTSGSRRAGGEIPLGYSTNMRPVARKVYSRVVSPGIKPRGASFVRYTYFTSISTRLSSLISAGYISINLRAVATAQR